MSIDAQVQLCHSEDEHGDKLRLRAWITVQLIGEDDEAIAGEAYTIVLPGGAVIEGKLGADGTVTLRDIPPGSCRVSFPNLDKDAWIPAETKGGSGGGTAATEPSEGQAA